MPSNDDVSDYYNQTQNHYEQWWNLKNTLALHYGIWYKETRNFEEALSNTNKVLFTLGDIKDGDAVLDAGCGVGGSSFYVAEHCNARVTGITLSEKQLDLANEEVKRRKKEQEVDFQLMDFCETTFNNASFDVIWACESMCHASNKEAFLAECYRLLKPGGRLIIADFFATAKYHQDPNQWLQKWADTWSVPGFITINSFIELLQETAFQTYEYKNYTEHIQRSAKRLYRASLMGAPVAILYNITHNDVGKFAKTHYKSGFLQYKALKARLWEYIVLKIEKKD